MSKKNFLYAGIVGGFTAVTCCITPMILILLGFGTAVGMAFMHQFHIISIVSGIIFMLLLSLYLVKRQSGVCNVNAIKKQWLSITIAIGMMIGSLLFINYLIVAPVASLVYDNLEVHQKPLGNLQEMAESHGMSGMASIDIVPENQGKKAIALQIDGLFCGSCGPAIEFDIKSVSGVLGTEFTGNKLVILYDSDITSKDVIMASVHEPYSAILLSEKQVE